MKIFINYCIVSVFICLLSACCRGIPVTDQTKAMYEQAKSIYSELDTQFLPDLEAGRLIYFGVSNSGEGRSKLPNYIHIIMKLPENELKKLQMRTSSIKRSFNDTNLLILDYDPMKVTHFKKLSLSDRSDILPIPNFDFIQDNIFSSSYVDKAIIYSLGHGRGPMIDKEYLRTDRAGLPMDWEHGMTKGVVIWDNYVAYWIDAW